MTDKLDPYPGNLKKHEVTAEYVKIPESYRLSLSFPIDPEKKKEWDAFCEELAHDMIDAHKASPMTTNDPQAPYREPRAEQREPLLSDGAINTWSSWEYGEHANHAIKSFIKVCRDFYESKITSGELKINFTKPREVICEDGRTPCLVCTLCGTSWVKGAGCRDRCGTCGAKIIA